MTLGPNIDTAISEDQTIAAEVARLIEHRNKGSRVVKVTSKRNDFATKQRSQIVTAVLADGSRVESFVKRVHPAPRNRPTADPPDRELRVYRDLLADEPAAPPLIGWIREKEGLRLVLERVEGLDLRYHDLDVWAEAVATLARLHAVMMDDPRLALLDYLVVRDSGLARKEAFAAQEVVRAHCNDTALSESLLEGHDRILDAMATVPTTLVHGDLAPKNVLAAATGADHRICFVDWEWAGVGCGFVDLVDLLFGLDRPDWDRMAKTYLEEAAKTGLVSGDERTTGRSLAACEAQRYLWRLSRGPDWGVGPEQLLVWARRALDLYSML